MHKHTHTNCMSYTHTRMFCVDKIYTNKCINVNVDIL